ncbi:MAG: hypothetical protein NC324_03860 [Bacteroides sp.]|nr:hypothetical protein [Bacteroides sp.]
MMFKHGSFIAIASLCGVLMFTTSCKTPREKRLEAENARLNDEIIKSDSVQIQFMNAYAEIDANLQAIKVREKMINRNSQEAEENADVQQRIIADIVEIGKLMEKNRQKLQSMESLRRELVNARAESKKLKAENVALKESSHTVGNPQDAERIAALEKENARLTELNQGFQKTIAALKKQLAESEARIESLQQELASLKDAYAALENINRELKANEQQYLAQLDEKEATISSLNSQLTQSKTVYYIAAPAKALKSKGIVVKNAVSSDVKLTALTAVADYNELRVIETKSSKAEVVSSHPKGSYRIDAKDKKNVKIEITNPQNFWSVSRVCVISTK